MSVFMLVTAIIPSICIGIYLYFLFSRLFSLIPKLREQKIWKRLISAVLALGVTICCYGFYTMRFIVLLHFICIAAIVDLINLLIKRIGSYKVWNFLYKSSVLSLAICIAYIGYGYYNMGNVKDTVYTLQSEKLDAPVKIAYISDLHMGTTMDVDTFAAYCEQIKEQNPALLLLGGDIVDESTTREELQGMAKAIGGIAPVYGTYFVFGNHDEFSDSYTHGRLISKSDVENAFSQNNIEILEDEAVTVAGRICLIGRAAVSYQTAADRKTLDELFVNMDHSKYLILMDHQPLELEAVAQKGVDLMLCGHTHAGQLWPVGSLSELFHTNELNYGAKNIGQMTAIVSSGMGGWRIPLRTGSRSEIVYLTVS